MSTVVVKFGSSTVTQSRGEINLSLIERVGAEVARLHGEGNRIVIVSSGAIAAGWSALSPGKPRPVEMGVLQAVSALGQPLLMRAWQESLAKYGLHAGQVLLDPLDFGHRRQYLHARATIGHLLDLGVIPIINENDALTDEEIRFGDNDRLSALVAMLIEADLLLLLSDIDGLFTADPRVRDGSLIEEIDYIDNDLLSMAGGAGSVVGSGGMASKLAAARIATWSGIPAVIANGERENAITDSLDGRSGVGTHVRPRPERLSAKKVWIAFARDAKGSLVVDEGAADALIRSGSSLLAAGVLSVQGSFENDDVVEVLTQSGVLIGKGVVRYPAERAHEWVGKRRGGLPDDLGGEVIHRDDLVVLADSLGAPASQG
jgi:glutamate 5-kinase